MARIVWTREALHSIELIRAHIQQFDPGAAQRMARRLIEAADSLRDFPDRGRPVAGCYRELPIVPPSVIRYRVDADRVLILRIRHGRQDQP
jgi:plasmid stabilization system protein ParE